MTGVSSHVGGGSRVPGGAGGGTSSGVLRVARGRMGGRRRGPRLADPYLTARPGPRRLDGFAGPVILQPMLFKQRKYVLGAVGGPERERPVVVLADGRSFHNSGGVSAIRPGFSKYTSMTASDCRSERVITYPCRS